MHTTRNGFYMHWKRAMIDLNPNHLATVERILTKHVPECEVRAFGSRATWTSKDYSDLDLAIVGSGPLDWRTLGRLKEAFEDSDLPIQVDVLDWHSISESFRKVIERDYVIVQDGVNGRRAALTVTSGEWSETPFRQAVQINPTVRLRRGAVYPFVDMAAVNPDSRSANPAEEREFKGSGSRFQSGDTLMARITPCLENGKIARYQAIGDKQEAHGSTEFIVIRGRSGVTDNDFAYYLTQWGEVRSYAIGQMTGTSGRQRVPVDCLNHLEIPLPPLPQQRAIAHVLGTLDDKIELNRRMNETLEAMAQALFKSWFVDFDPVRAKMEGRWRRGESIPGFPADLYDLFPDRCVDSELGEIPKGWEVKALGVVVELNPKEPMKRRTLAPYLDMAALPTSGSSPDASLLREFKSGTRFRNGDTLLARITPCLENGKTAFVQSLQDGEVGWGSTEFIVLRAIPPVPPEYTYLLARDAAFREHAIQSMTGTSGRQRVQVDALAPYLLPSPPAETWNEFRALVNPLFAQVEFNRKESLALAAQRDALLPRLVSGELAVGTE